MTDQTINLVTQTFLYIYPRCPTLFVFDNASNHAYFVENTLLTRKMNLSVDEKQPQMRDRFNNITQQTQLMVFSDNHLDVSLQDKPKKLKQVLIKRSLWRN